MAKRRRSWPPSWLRFLIYVLVLPALGLLAKMLADRQPDSFVKSFLGEMAHYIPVIGWVGIGVILGAHAFGDVMQEFAPEFFDTMSESIEGVGEAIAACIANKTFLTQEIIEALVSRPQPLAQSDKPSVTKIREIFEKGLADQAISQADEVIASDKESEATKSDARRLLLQMCVYSNRDQYWRKAEPLLQEYGTLELTALLGFKFWTKRHLREAIIYGDQALQMATATGDSVKLARAKNNLAYYIADARDASREAEARTYAEEAYLGIKRAVAEKLANADALLEAKMLTTLGFVRIIFAKTIDECLQGIENCTDGVRRGADDELLRTRHLPIATEKIAELQRGEKLKEPKIPEKPKNPEKK